MIAARVKHSPVNTRQVHTDRTCPRSCREVNLQVWLQISRDHRQAELQSSIPLTQLRQNQKGHRAEHKRGSSACGQRWWWRPQLRLLRTVNTLRALTRVLISLTLRAGAAEFSGICLGQVFSITALWTGWLCPPLLIFQFDCVWLPEVCIALWKEKLLREEA